MTNDIKDQLIIEGFKQDLIEINSFITDQIPMSNNLSRNTVEDCINKFDTICNSYLRRIINLSHNYEETVNKKEGLIEAIIARVLLESVAHFHYFLEQMSKYSNKQEYSKIYEILARYMAGGDHGYEGKAKKLERISVMDSIRSISKKREHFFLMYDRLCEFSHPNGMGTCMMFSKEDLKEQKIYFSTNPYSYYSSTPYLYGSMILPVFCEDWKRSFSVRKNLEEKWKPSDEIYKFCSEITSF